MAASTVARMPVGFETLGIMGRSSVTTVPCIDGREAVDIAALERALDTQAGRPFIVVANAGTVNTVDFDELTAIAALWDRFPFWLHVDAAFGAFAALSPDLAPLVEGLALADSVCVDAQGDRIRDSSEFALCRTCGSTWCASPWPPTGPKRPLQRFVDALRDGGQAFMTPTVLFGRPGVRAAFSNWRTGDEGVEIVWRAMCDATARV